MQLFLSQDVIHVVLMNCYVIKCINIVSTSLWFTVFWRNHTWSCKKTWIRLHRKLPVQNAQKLSLTLCDYTSDLISCNSLASCLPVVIPMQRSFLLWADEPLAMTCLSRDSRQRRMYFRLKVKAPHCLRVSFATSIQWRQTRSTENLSHFKDSFTIEVSITQYDLHQPDICMTSLSVTVTW